MSKKLAILLVLPLFLCFAPINVKAGDIIGGGTESMEGAFDLTPAAPSTTTASVPTTTVSPNTATKDNPTTADNNSIYIVSALAVSCALIFVIKKFRQSAFN